ncbi:uncharacterized protein C8Q71DRAFT_839903 [Rhodofomes roseus]|uniref:Uncharacterized protein n=1 Tax=Rhodofomes roseus TaxID=34475 RepID=A0A4Y9XX65_9APHY|nr:uncharacterized protein C8Q71DRAFT_839903 [Rhodofomes roseus]KAH9832950.1 hypothetical protein C8Q71DRAFT_839903 [Rhodofomes roseus]TFY54372.1 hypothetical protein EVJ58_g8905 [Rhodofomes roseus]
MSLAEAMPQHIVASASSTPTSSNRESAAPNASANTNTSPSAKSRDSRSFEFTRRKRWADLLVTELREAIMLVLSPACKVWYCGTAVEDLLGWKDEDLVDGDITDLMNVDDRPSFRSHFQESLHARGSLLTYARLQCKNEFYMASDYSSRPREVLFEITGKPHFFPDSDDFRCFFAVAKPYPSRNTAMVNTFLELKMENERLQQRVTHLRAQAKALNVMFPSASPTLSSASSVTQLAPHVSQRTSDGLYTIFDETLAGGTSFGGQGHDALNDADDDGSDPNGSRKKAKRIFNGGEQHVCQTCGRTDSPEWRKGPGGPKTLCNACGLRWAKKLRTDKSGEGTGGSADGDSVIF